MKRIVSAVLALLFLFGLAGCAAGQTEAAGSDTPQYKERLVTAYPDDIPTWDPYGTTHTATAYVNNMIFDQLIEQNYDGQLVPRVAQSWADVSPDQNGTVWEFYLAENARFHDGTPLTAADVKFTLEYCAPESENVARTLPVGSYIQQMDVVDDYTLRITLKNPLADLPYYMNFYILSENAFNTLPAEQACLIGSGPYVKDEAGTQVGVSFSVERYEAYWGSLEDYPSRYITFKVINDYNTIMAAMESHELDFYYPFPASMLASLQAENLEGLTVDVFPTSTLVYLGYNHSREAMQDVTVRRAIAMAVNPDDLQAIAFENGLGGETVDNMCVPNAAGYTQVEGVSYDPAGARALLEQAGYGDLTVTLMHYHYLAAFAQVIQSNLIAAGIDCQLVEADATNWVATKSSLEGYDLFVDYISCDGAPMYNFNRLMRSDGNSNLYGFSSAEYDALNDAVLNAPTYDDMLDRFAELQQWVADNVPCFPLGVLSMNYVYWDGVGGIAYYAGVNSTNFRTFYALES